ncbi:MAG: hypothetical protein IKZ43_06880, partial [Acidaminococcaceae bacterium]|nr:hypothetical protein [Acidaminococcaceae bacterium]
AKHEKNFKPDQEKAKIATYFNEKQSLTNSSTKPFVRLFPSRNCQRWGIVSFAIRSRFYQFFTKKVVTH